MINREDYLMIKQAREKGCYLEDIACQRGCSVSTVKRALKRQGPTPRRKSGVRPSKLDNFKPIIDALLAENVWNAEVIFAEIKEQGYAGGICWAFTPLWCSWQKHWFSFIRQRCILSW
ncbi:hypothetical protein [Endozoicomonas numazuensis]|uniref:hypothetical protein n=1 Tax=Endozoicomonas numazuensis TaxID=1137799 RepID=UPI000A42C95A|nr:hypothetical protein [Endozoicomonas numazuensis]